MKVIDREYIVTTQCECGAIQEHCYDFSSDHKQCDADAVHYCKDCGYHVNDNALKEIV